MTEHKKVLSKSDLLSKALLKIKDVAEILECSPDAVYDLINSGRQKAAGSLTMPVQKQDLDLQIFL
jgi:DNA-directed RNA polymerase specialized sigma24 family protein